MIFKIIWFVRFLFLKPFLGRFSFFSYWGKPIFLSGLKNIFLGHKVRIFPHNRIEVFDNGSLSIEDNVSIQQNVHITVADEMIIGEGSLILANVFITDIEHTYSEFNLAPLEKKIEVRKTSIGKNCFIGIGASIQAGTVLGDNCIVGTNAVVRGEFPSGSVIVGVPARVIRNYNEKTASWDRVKSNEH
ncbi:DapH/DapD/GlmU-related protein [Vibrio cyclitrophicus]|uniref:DapH/DapD/GlmU-related protein n=1 Tax=Vibrio cyclitrophicus TaxID=47951 RepID=UPI00399AC2A7